MTSKASLRTCINGHKYMKSSDCPVCPICESENKTKDNFLSYLAAPARRALENAQIKTIEQLAQYSEKEIMRLHGMGKSSIPKLKLILSENKLRFKNDQ